ncbi:hypothetical protein KAW18_01145 [candidate division WOR-3 bacterium]|nr:hypothetical protein [candidate division WOR-3 bacterium]
MMHHSAIDLTGQRFNRLTVIEPTEKRSSKCVVWRCLCDCGNEAFVNSNNLKSGGVKSCGCLSRETKTTHGMSGTREYWTYRCMIDRCYNPKAPNYKDYGDRGIKVCDRWRNSFEAFYEDMGPRPKGMTIDRIDSYGNYKLSNCQWATGHEQRMNCRPRSCGPNRQRWFMAFSLNTGEWFEDDNQQKFAKQHRLQCSSISRCLHKKLKTTGNWIFEFLPYQDNK